MVSTPLEQIKLDISAKLAQAQDEIEKQSVALRLRQQQLETDASNSLASIMKERQEMLADVELEKKKLAEQQAAFEAEKSAVMAANIQFDTKIKLDVGGVHYTTTKTTLCSVPGSMLEAMFSGRFPIKLDADDRAFIDRDGQTFREVLNFLRSRHAYTWPPDVKAAADLRVELEYFNLTGVIQAPTTVLPVLSEEQCSHRTSGLRVVLHAKRPLMIDGFRSSFQDDVHGKRLRVYSKSGNYADARLAMDEADWKLVQDSVLQPDHSLPFKNVCVGLGVRVEPGWHTFYLHYESAEETHKASRAKLPIAMGGPSVEPVIRTTNEAIASDGVLEVYRGCYTNSETPFRNPNWYCSGFVGEVIYEKC